jgi:hypothetical protein
MEAKGFVVPPGQGRVWEMALRFPAIARRNNSREAVAEEFDARTRLRDIASPQSPIPAEAEG